jgi:hypothetical protein
MNSAGSGGTPPAVAGAGGAPATGHRFSIAIDYRFDTAGFFTPEKRAVLEAATNIWEALILDDFDEIPADTPVQIPAIEDATAANLSFSLDEPIDDLVLFIGCDEGLSVQDVNAETRSADFYTGALGAEFQNALLERWRGPDFEPRAVSIAFSCVPTNPWFFDETPETSEDIPPDG